MCLHIVKYVWPHINVLCEFRTHVIVGNVKMKFMEGSGVKVYTLVMCGEF